jgi:hypothetical protein
MAGRVMLPTESRCSVIERLMICALWGYKRFRRYTEYAPRVVVVVPYAAELAAVQAKEPTMRIQGMLIELSSLNV